MAGSGSPASPGRAPHADGGCCRTRRRNAHVTDCFELLYPWHPWFGDRVFVHDVIVKGGDRIFRCGSSPDRNARCIEVPGWMFDRAACCSVRLSNEAQVDCTSLQLLKALIVAVGHAEGLALPGVESGHLAFPSEEEADARPQPFSPLPSNC